MSLCTLETEYEKSLDFTLDLSLSTISILWYFLSDISILLNNSSKVESSILMLNKNG